MKVDYKDIIKEKMTIKEIKEFIDKNGSICILSTYVGYCFQDMEFHFSRVYGYFMRKLYCDNTPLGNFGEYYYIKKEEKE